MTTSSGGGWGGHQHCSLWWSLRKTSAPQMTWSGFFLLFFLLSIPHNQSHFIGVNGSTFPSMVKPIVNGGALNVNSLKARLVHSLGMNWLWAPHRVGAGSSFLNSLWPVMAPSSRPKAPSGTVEVTYCYPLSFVEPQQTHEKKMVICLLIRSV